MCGTSGIIKKKKKKSQSRGADVLSQMQQPTSSLDSDHKLNSASSIDLADTHSPPCPRHHHTRVLQGILCPNHWPFPVLPSPALPLSNLSHFILSGSFLIETFSVCKFRVPSGALLQCVCCLGQLTQGPTTALGGYHQSASMPLKAK